MQVEEELAKHISNLKITLQGTPEFEAEPSMVVALVSTIVADGLLPILVDNIHRLPFEARKDTQTIVSNVFRWRSPGSTSTEPDALREVIHKQPELIVALCNGYSRRESASPCGGILKEALKWDAVAAVILYDEPMPNGKTVDIYNEVDTSKPSSGRGVFWNFFGWIDKSSFEISADAFDTFRLLLTKHKPLVSQYIGTNFDMFFERYNNVLIRSESYVTKRQSIKLLGEVLLDRQFYEVMTRYVDSGDNLKLIMWQLKDDRRMVQYEGFHVFKVRTEHVLDERREHGRANYPLLPTDLRRQPQQILRSAKVPHHEQAAPAEIPPQFPGRPHRRRSVQRREGLARQSHWKLARLDRGSHTPTTFAQRFLINTTTTTTTTAVAAVAAAANITAAATSPSKVLMTGRFALPFPQIVHGGVFRL